MEQKLRKTGTEVIGDMPWGTHICHFYQTKRDLVDVLVPYFKAGLENNEFCVWVTSEPLGGKDARAALKKKVKNLDDYIDKKQIEIFEHSQWYTKSGKFEPDKVLAGWLGKEKEAIEKGFDGLRAAGNAFWVDWKSGKDLIKYEARVNRFIGKYRMLTICSYFLGNFKISVIDVVNNHQFALIRRGGKWVRLKRGFRRNSVSSFRE
jgi:hypothetical protein